ncbi:hypothetical protein [Promicromonospora umidemergens]|uniref:Uncharacterized protein n=1 Tax=Promicromonospora umidemergens TaxID=629679 RepID=A0ABP8WEW6_9MICO|nr:hypothetical protein [Promicromonospora umidemergens]
MSESVNQPAAPVRPATSTPSAEQAARDADEATGDAAPRRRGPRRAVRRGTEREAVLGVSSDERPAGWGEGSDGGPGSNGNGSNDEQLRQDVPPHWG